VFTQNRPAGGKFQASGCRWLASSKIRIKTKLAISGVARGTLGVLSPL